MSVALLGVRRSLHRCRSTVVTLGVRDEYTLSPRTRAVADKAANSTVVEADAGRPGNSPDWSSAVRTTIRSVTVDELVDRRQARERPKE